MSVPLVVYNSTLANLSALQNALQGLQGHVKAMGRIYAPPLPESVTTASTCALRDALNAYDNLRQVWNDYIVPNTVGTEPWPPAEGS